MWTEEAMKCAGVGVLIKKCPEICYGDPDTDPRIMAINIKVRGFSIRFVNVYAPTNCNKTYSIES